MKLDADKLAHALADTWEKVTGRRPYVDISVYPVGASVTDVTRGRPGGAGERYQYTPPSLIELHITLSYPASAVESSRYLEVKGA